MKLTIGLAAALAGCAADPGGAGETGGSTGTAASGVGESSSTAATAPTTTSDPSSSSSSSSAESTSGSASSGTSEQSSSDGGSSSTGDPLIDTNVAFVTSQAWPAAELGGLAGADVRCQDAAEAAGLPDNTYIAFLTDDVSQPDDADRLGSARGWVRPDGRPFADTIEQLVSEGPQWYLLRLDELGNDVGPVRVPGGTPSDVGGPYGNCVNWTEDDLSDIWGLWNSSSGWNWWGGVVLTDGCDDPRRLFCLGRDKSTPVDPPSAADGRLAFLSTPFTVTAGGGLASADSHCNADAADAGLDGDFAALLPTSTQAPADRFDLEGEGWVRTDGLWFMQDPHALEDGAPELPMEYRADGDLGTLWPVSRHFTGTSSPTDVCVDCCADWTDPTGTATSAESFTTEDWWYTDDITVACSVEQTLVCLER